MPRRNESTGIRLELADELADFQESDISERSGASSTHTPASATAAATRELRPRSRSPVWKQSSAKAQSEVKSPAFFGNRERQCKDEDEMEVFTFAVDDADSAETKRTQASPIPKFKPHVISEKKWRGKVD